LWVQHSAGKIAFEPVINREDTVFFATQTGRIMAFDTSTGREWYRFTQNEYIPTAPLFHDATGAHFIPYGTHAIQCMKFLKFSKINKTHD
jgi:outer membrane protein assembly factor BamB